MVSEASSKLNGHRNLNPSLFTSILQRILRRSKLVTITVAADTPFHLQSRPIQLNEGRTYLAVTEAVGLTGQKYSGYFTVVILGTDSKEILRRRQWLNDFSGNPKQYSIVFKAPPGARFAVVGYRINLEETRASASQFRLCHPELIKLREIDDRDASETPDWSIAPDEFEVEMNGIRFRFHDPPGQLFGSVYWRNLLLDTPYEYSVVKHLAQLTKRYDSAEFLDVGAHYGYYTLYMSKLVGVSGKVYSFEPNEGYFDVLSRNVEINHLRNVRLYQIALSDKRGNVVLETSKEFQSYGLTLERRKMRSAKPGELSVPALPFDQLGQEENILPNIVKIDVHGAEGNVIYGMRNSLKHSVEHLYCELHNEMCDGYTTRDIIDALQDTGMETFEFHGFRSKEGKLLEIRNILDDLRGDRMIYARKHCSERV